MTISFIWLVCSWWVRNYSTSFERTQSSDFGKGWRGIFYSLLFSSPDHYIASWLSFPRRGYSGRSLMTCSRIFRPSAFLVFLISSTLGHQNIIWFWRHVPRGYNTGKVLFLFYLTCFFFRMSSINIIGSLACVCIYVEKQQAYCSWTFSKEAIKELA